MTELSYLALLWDYSLARLRALHTEEEGEVLEKAIIAFIFATLALAVGGIIGAKVISKANSIPTE